MQEEFRRQLEKLNAKQKQAVEAIEGPVMVVAGPGTGKTQLLSMRVANILRQTDAKPGNILALTFTNKAAVNMQDRIIELAGREGARVPASTFHSFAAEIMNLYPDSFWNAARLSIAPDSVQLDIIESIVKELPLDNPLALKFAGQYTLLSQIKGGLKLAKEAGLTPGKLRAIVEFNLAYIDSIEAALAKLLEPRLSVSKLPTLAAEIESITNQEIAADLYPLTPLSAVLNETLHQAIDQDEATGKTSNTSKWKTRWIQVVDGKRGMFDERKRNQWWLELAGVYETYRDELHRRGFYDYSDMLVEVIAQLDQDPAMLADVQERFSYVLVDEFQDSTPAQLRLAHLIADHHSAEGKPNLMVVGDDDQTIYKFNGAEANNLLNFERLYPSAKKIVLTENYRSSQNILDFAAKLIDQAETRLVKLDKSLRKDLRATKKGGGSIRALAFNSEELQLSEIARDIKKHHRQGSVAVLARSHDSLIKMTGILEQLKVPVRYEQSANILEHPIIQQTYLIARLLLAIQDGNKPGANALLHRILRWPTWDIDAKKLWRLAERNYRQPHWLEDLLENQDKQLRVLGEWFVWLAKAADSQPLAVTLEQILGLRESDGFKSPMRDYYLKLEPSATNDYFYGLSAIQLLRSMVHEFGAEKQPTIMDLVRYIEINQTNEIVVADESPFITGTSAVQLLTVHKAKGLEFDRVYIIDAIDKDWRPRGGGRKPPANLPLQPAGDDLDDYIRLMYVAVTRAKSAVTISGYNQDHSGRDVALSAVIQAAQPFEDVAETNQKTLVGVLEENLRWPELSGGQEKAMLKAQLEEFNLNVTHLQHFLDVTKGGPAYFKERHLLRLPEVKSPAQSFGTAIHAALKRAQLQANRGKLSLPAISKEFAKALREEQLMTPDEKRYLAKGQRLLEKLLPQLELTKGSLAEYELRGVRLGEARLAGVLDRVDRGDSSTNIVDYKTGRPLVSFETRSQNEMLRAWRHKTQLIFYALLLEAQGETSPISGEMIYVEADRAKDLSRRYTPTAQDKEYLMALIRAVWRKIQTLDLPDTSRYSQDLAGIKAFEKDLIEKKI